MYVLGNKPSGLWLTNCGEQQENVNRYKTYVLPEPTRDLPMFPAALLISAGTPRREIESSIRALILHQRATFQKENSLHFALMHRSRFSLCRVA